MVEVTKIFFSGLRSRILFLWNRIDSVLKTHEQAIFWIFAALYKLALDAMYVWAASPAFSYGGLIYSPNSAKYLISNVLYLILFAYLPRKENDAAGFLLQLQFVFTIAPMLTVYGLVDRSTLYMVVVFLCAMLQIYIIRRPASNLKNIHIKGIESYVTVAMGILVVFALVVPIIYNGFQGLKAFDFSYVYTIRTQASYPTGFAYILHWCAKVILPFGLLMFLEKKKYFWAVLCAALQVQLFLQSGYKGFLLFLIPVIAIYLFAKTGHLLKLMYIGLTTLSFLTAFCYQMDLLNRNKLGGFLASLVGVRAILGPANNKFLFYDCFSKYPKTFFSDGQIGRMLGLTYPYNTGHGQIIYAFDGGEFMGSNSCTGFWGDAYAQMGFLGILLMSVLLAFIIRGIRSYDRKNTFCILTALFSVYIIILNDGALLTTLVSGGMLFAYLLVFIYLSNGSKGERNGIPCN